MSSIFQSKEIAFERDNLEVISNALPRQREMKTMRRCVSNIDKAWIDGTLIQRKSLTGSIFPENLIYEKGEFRTTKLGPCFEIMQGFNTLPISSWVLDNEILEPICAQIIKLRDSFTLSYNQAFLR